MREFGTSEKLDDVLEKISKKNNLLYKQIMKKIKEVIDSPAVEHYKNLRAPLNNLKRVHVGHFVLVFSYNKKKDFVSFENFDHHDKIYKT